MALDIKLDIALVLFPMISDLKKSGCQRIFETKEINLNQSILWFIII